MENLENLGYIELSDGENTKKLKIVDTFGIEDKDYASLLDEQEQQLYVLEVEMDGDEVTFLPIEDEKELAEILSLYEELLDEEEQE